MGFKTCINKEDLLHLFDIEKLENSNDGHTDSVYFIDDKYVVIATYY